MDNMITQVRHQAVLSFLAALYIELLLVAKILMAAMPAFGSMMIPLHIGVASIFVILTLNERFRNIKSSWESWLVFFTCIFAYYFTVNHSPYTSELNIVYFIPHVLFPIFIAQQTLDAKVFLFSAMSIPFAGVFFLGKLFALTDYGDSISMSTSYAFILPVMATIVFYFKYYKSSAPSTKFLTAIFALINAVYLLEVFLYGSRGAVLSLFIMFIVLYLFPIKSGHGLAKINIKSFLSIVLLWIVVSNLPDTIALIDSLLSSVGLKIYSIERSIEYMRAGDITTGRSGLTEATIAYIYQKPIWGHGLQTFSDGFYGELGYPHNSILQFLFDGGVVLALLIVGPVVYKMIKWWRTCNINEYCIVLTIFCASVPGSFFSMDVWTQPILWFFIGYIAKYKQPTVRTSKAKANYEYPY